MAEPTAADPAPGVAPEQAFERVGVVGCGLMGSGIAEVCARAGIDVVVVEVDPEALAVGRQRIESSLARAERTGKVDRTELASTWGRVRFSTEMADLSDRQLVVEAVVEDPDVKLSVFAELDKAVGPDAIFASNTSSIPIMKLAMATSRASQVVGLHFFNPVPVMRLVELVPSLLTSDETADRAADFAGTVLGKRVVRAGDRAGFIVNALLIPYIISSIRMLESGFATAADIDTGMVEGCAHPMGPLALADLIGLDTVLAVARSLYDEFKEPLFAPPPLLARMCEAGLLGRKRGRGFYDY